MELLHPPNLAGTGEPAGCGSAHGTEVLGEVGGRGVQAGLDAREHGERFLGVCNGIVGIISRGAG